MSAEIFHLLLRALLETLYMTFASGIFSIIFGLPLGIILLTTRPNHLYSCPWLHRTISMCVNVMRSLPFIILLIALIPLTRWIIGTSIGTTAAIVPLTVGAIPFFARLVENSLEEVPAGLIEAGHAMGARPFHIILKILLPEALPALINSITLMLITLINYSAMAGVIGGGGLGDVAVRYGYQRFELNVMFMTVVLLILLVQCIQTVGHRLAQRITQQRNS